MCINFRKKKKKKSKAEEVVETVEKVEAKSQATHTDNRTPAQIAYDKVQEQRVSSHYSSNILV